MISGVRASSIEDRVDLVHDREGVAALDRALERDRHVVAQVVEAELGVRPVRDVGRVGLRALRERHHVLDEAGADAQHVVGGLDPLRVALGQVVVDRDEMDVLAPSSEFRYSGIVATNVFPSPVFISAMSPSWRTMPPIIWTSKRRTPIGALERLAHRRERLEEDVLERLAVGDALPELGGLALHLLVGELLELGLERSDVLGLASQPLEPPAFADAQKALEATVIVAGHRL